MDKCKCFGCWIESGGEYEGIEDETLCYRHLKEAYHEVLAELRECSDIARRLDAMNPDMPGAFTGTISKRIKRHMDML